MNLMVDSPTHSDTITLNEGDFALISAARGFATSSLARQPPREGETVTRHVGMPPGRYSKGEIDGVLA